MVQIGVILILEFELISTESPSVVVGDGGKILRSNDNASSWNNGTFPITTGLKGITFSE